MKKLSLKSGCSLLIAVFGAVLPLSAAQAATQDDMGAELGRAPRSRTLRRRSTTMIFGRCQRDPKVRSART